MPTGRSEKRKKVLEFLACVGSSCLYGLLAPACGLQNQGLRGTPHSWVCPAFRLSDSPPKETTFEPLGRW